MLEGVRLVLAGWEKEHIIGGVPELRGGDYCLRRLLDALSLPFSLLFAFPDRFLIFLFAKKVLKDKWSPLGNPKSYSVIRNLK